MAIFRIGNKDLQAPSNGMAAAAAYQAAMMGQCGGIPPAYVAGVTAPQYGMPMCGTPIGLPGPPHVPLGVPAGLQRHVIANHTCVDVPGPTESMRIDVKQSPCMSYPKPVNHICIEEKTTMGVGVFHQPASDAHQMIRAGGPGVCPTGYEGPCQGAGPYDPSAAGAAAAGAPAGEAPAAGPACSNGASK
jgi:hypothetical protein